MIITLHRLDTHSVKEILTLLDNAFGLVWANAFAVHGNTISARSILDKDLSRKFTTPRFIIEIQSSFFVKSTIMNSLEGYNCEFFVKA